MIHFLRGAVKALAACVAAGMISACASSAQIFPSSAQAVLATPAPIGQTADVSVSDGSFRLAVTESLHGNAALAQAVNPDYAGNDPDAVTAVRLVGECLAAPAAGAWLAAPPEVTVWAAGKAMPQTTLLVPRQPLLGRYRPGARVDGWLFITGRPGELILQMGDVEFQLR